MFIHRCYEDQRTELWLMWDSLVTPIKGRQFLTFLPCSHTSNNHLRVLQLFVINNFIYRLLTRLVDVTSCAFLVYLWLYHPIRIDSFFFRAWVPSRNLFDLKYKPPVKKSKAWTQAIFELQEHVRLLKERNGQSRVSIWYDILQGFAANFVLQTFDINVTRDTTD